MENIPLPLIRHATQQGWVRPGPTLHPGDRFTIAGVSIRPTWYQWLTRQPRRLQILYAKETVTY
jgi:hypothetical protein